MAIRIIQKGNISTLEDQLPEDVKALIIEHNTYDKLQNFLSKNRDIYELIKGCVNEYRKSEIERELIPFIHSNYHGKKVKAYSKGNIGGNDNVEGVIEHELTREYTYKEEKKITDNTVSFRWRDNNKILIC